MMHDIPLILIADHNIASRQYLAHTLQEDGYRVLSVSDSHACLKASTQFQPSLVVIDAGLPPSGAIHACELIRRSGLNRIPLLLIAGDDPQTLDLLFSAGATDVITPPIRAIVLRQRAKLLIRASQSEIEHAKRQHTEAELRRVFTGARCVVWYALVQKTAGVYHWDLQISNEEAAQDFFPLAMQPDQSYTDAWLAAKQSDEKPLLAKRADDALANNNRGYAQEYRISTTQGFRWLYEDVQIKPISATVWTLTGICTDVTDKKHAEAEREQAFSELEGRIQERTAALTNLVEELRQTEAELLISRGELQQQSDSLTALNIVADTLYRSLDLGTVSAAAVKCILDYTHADAASIYMYEEVTQEIVLQTASGLDDEVFARAARLTLQNTLTGLAIQQRQTMIAMDLLNDERIKADTREILAQKHGLQSVMVVPMFYQETIGGAITVFFKRRLDLTPREHETIIALSQTISLAVANAQYVDKLRTERDQRRLAEAAEHEQRVLAEALRDTAAALTSTLYIGDVIDRVLNQIIRVVPQDGASVMLIEGDYARIIGSRGLTAQMMAEHGEQLRFNFAEVNNLMWMIENRKPMFVPDTQDYDGWIHLAVTSWIRSYVGAPIMMDGWVIGFLGVDSITPNTYNQKVADNLQAFANQVGIAIQNAKHYQAARQQASLLEQRVLERTAQLDRERAQLRTVLDNMGEGVLYDEQGQVRYVNQALLEMTGYTQAEISQQADLFNINPQVGDVDLRTFLTRIYGVIAQKGFAQSQPRVRRKDGTLFDADLMSTRVTDAHNNTIGIVILIRDISAEKALAEQKNRFVARASHELRTPIANIKTRLYLIERQPQRAHEHTAVIAQVTQHMAQLVEDLLNLSRFERGTIPLRRERVQLQTIVNHVLELQVFDAQAKHLQVQKAFVDAPIWVMGDPVHLTQVSTNLITNAIKYTPEGGKVEVILRTLPDARAQLIVSDNGIGIATEHLRFLFQPFYRADENTKGTGLGLSITREIIELHGGQISVESEFGKGSRFTVLLPMIAATAPLPAAHGSNKESS
jgi:PAS domain S-box-containing protein